MGSNDFLGRFQKRWYASHKMRVMLRGRGDGERNLRRYFLNEEVMKGLGSERKLAQKTQKEERARAKIDKSEVKLKSLYVKGFHQQTRRRAFP